MICYYYPEPLYLFYVPDLSGLLYYSHIPAIVIALVVGLFVFLNNRKELLNQLLFAICISFSLWTLFNLIAWTNIHVDFILFTWSLFGSMSAFISIFSIYFMYVFLEKRDAPAALKWVFLLLLAPVVLLAPTHAILRGFNIAYCDAFGFEAPGYETYYYSLGVLAMVWILALLIRAYRRAAPQFKKQIVLMGSGIELFLFSFFTTGPLAAYLVVTNIVPDSELEIYGLFGMIVFMVYVGIILVRFKTFHVPLIASQALVTALLLLIGSQLTFVRSTTNLVLTGITFVLTAMVGFVLIRSVKREIAQRHRIEALAGELEKSNQQQVILIHFITHQLKGFMAKSRNIFSMIHEGDFGALPEAMKPIVEEGLRSGTKGAQTIDEILNAANIKSGKVTYAREPVDLKVLTEGIVADQEGNAEDKSLVLSFMATDSALTVTGDRLQLTNAFKNLIDNAVKYTQEGHVSVKLSREEELVRLVVEDTGVGITPEDMKLLFTEGGHGKESRKVNVESTGFGLYIVKNIVEAHDGKVWAESEGAGKGSKFVVELPVS